MPKKPPHNVKPLRPRTETPVPDLSAYENLVNEARAAFRADPGYVIAMARQANLINLKRKKWREKAELKRAE